jgi:pimeloyl-ACP methyl ester carboxylesterase
VNVEAELARMECPVLTLSSKRDHIMRARIAQKLPTSTHIEIDAPHLLLQTRPVEAWAHITRFLAQPRE